MLNETDMRSLCIPYPAGGWDADSDNDTAGDIIAPSRAAAIMASTTSQGTLLPLFIVFTPFCSVLLERLGK